MHACAALWAGRPPSPPPLPQLCCSARLTLQLNTSHSPSVASTSTSSCTVRSTHATCARWALGEAVWRRTLIGNAGTCTRRVLLLLTSGSAMTKGRRKWSPMARDMASMPITRWLPLVNTMRPPAALMRACNRPPHHVDPAVWHMQRACVRAHQTPAVAHGMPPCRAAHRHAPETALCLRCEMRVLLCCSPCCRAMPAPLRPPGPACGRA